MLSGNIFNIQRFCTDDGDGIRTVVFLKGCQLRCLWCHNPESQSAKPQISYDKERCIQCGACVAECPNQCHRLIEKGKHQFDRMTCSACGICANNCPTNALEIAGSCYTVEEVMDITLKDEAFYGEKGGLTLSGGEPLAQGKFAIALAQKAKSHGMNVCIETSGFCQPDVLREISDYVDCFLFDYKCHPMDYRSYTGVEFAPIEKNLAFLAACGKRIVLRCPIVPACIRENHFDDIGRLAEKYHIQEVELLPYHNLGVAKSSRFDMATQQIFQAVDRNELCRTAQNIMKQYNISVIVR